MAHTDFISDLHLDTERPQIMTLFMDYLQNQARKAQALYILGDLFEYWIGDDGPISAMQPIIDALKALSASGVAVYLMHGNRDFLIGQDFAQRSGCTLIDDPCLIDLHGTPTLLMHGDTLCTDDVDYQKLRLQLRDPGWQAQFLAADVALRIQQAQALRQKSREAMQGKAEQIMDVNQNAVIAALREHQVLRLIHGHTHRPATHALEIDAKQAERIVLGDWYAHGHRLQCDAQGCRALIIS